MLVDDVLNIQFCYNFPERKMDIRSQRPKKPAIVYPTRPSKENPKRWGPRFVVIMSDDPIIIAAIMRENAILFDDLSISKMKFSSPRCSKRMRDFPCFIWMIISCKSSGIAFKC